jgi:hypothetical protein
MILIMESTRKLAFGREVGRKSDRYCRNEEGEMDMKMYSEKSREVKIWGVRRDALE